MRAVIQRVTRAMVETDGKIVGDIGRGILVLLGVSDDDTEGDIKYLAEKIMELRIFPDDKDKMNLSLRDVGGQLLIVSQFTLYGDCRKGRRPSFDAAGAPAYAKEMYEKFIAYCAASGIKTDHGVFGADMKVSLINDGPVTLILESCGR